MTFVMRGPLLVLGLAFIITRTNCQTDNNTKIESNETVTPSPGLTNEHDVSYLTEIKYGVGYPPCNSQVSTLGSTSMYGPGHGSMYEPASGSTYGANAGPSAGVAMKSMYGPSHGSMYGPGHESMYGPSHGSMYGSGTGKMYEPGHGSTYGASTGSSAGVGMKSMYAPGHESVYGPSHESMYGSGTGSKYGPSHASTYGPGHGSMYEPNHGLMYGSGTGKMYGPSQASTYGASAGSSGMKPVYGSSHESMYGSGTGSKYEPSHESMYGPGHESMYGPSHGSMYESGAGSKYDPGRESMYVPGHGSMYSPSYRSMYGSGHGSSGVVAGGSSGKNYVSPTQAVARVLEYLAQLETPQGPVTDLSSVPVVNLSPSNTNSQQLQGLASDHALSYLNQVKSECSSQPQVYYELLNTLNELQSQSKDVSSLTAKVRHILKDYPGLIAGFNSFLPPGQQVQAPASHLSSY